MPEVEIRAQQIAFPPVCPICLVSATQRSTVSKRLWVPGIMSQSMSLQVPFCEHHNALYTKSDSLISKLTVFWMVLVTLFAGVLTLLAMISVNDFSMDRLRAAGAGQNLLLLLPLCGAFGIGFVISVLFVPIIGPIAHYFDSPETRTVRKAFRIRSFNVDPGMHSSTLTRVTFSVNNPTYAGLLAQANNVKINN